MRTSIRESAWESERATSAPKRQTRLGTLFGTVAVELEPYAKEAGHYLRLLRKSPLAKVGLGIVVFFVFLAIFGPFLAELSGSPTYFYNDFEKNAAPFSRPPVQVNESARSFAGFGWNHTEFLEREDDLYARSDRVNDTLILRRFDLVRDPRPAVYTDYIDSLGVNVQVNSTVGSPGSILEISVSGDNGTTWSSPKRTSLRYSDVDSVWFFLDFTRATPWTRPKLGQLAVRAVHSFDPAVGQGPIGVDVLRVVVRFLGNYHILGTTEAGEDVLTGILLGARISIRIGIAVTAITALIGVLLGALSGYFGGWMDELIMRMTDIFLSIPGLILALAVAAADPFRLGRSLDNVLYALVIVSWPVYTRLVRGQALSVRENAFIEAARASGASDVKIVFRHILPNTLSPILVQASFDVGTIVLVAAGLSFLGLGAQPGTPEWGLMVSRGFSFFPQNWWQVSFSGLMIFMFTLGFNLLGDGLRDVLDPRIRR